VILGIDPVAGSFLYVGVDHHDSTTGIIGLPQDSTTSAKEVEVDAAIGTYDGVGEEAVDRNPTFVLGAAAVLDADLGVLEAGDAACFGKQARVPLAFEDRDVVVDQGAVGDVDGSCCGFVHCWGFLPMTTMVDLGLSVVSWTSPSRL